MMFGTRDVFEYLECVKCGTLQIIEIPDLRKYYPSNYYSLDRSVGSELAKSFRRRIAARLMGKYLVTGQGLIGKYLSEKRPLIKAYFPPSLLDPLLDLRFDSRILDLGCGNGQLLRTLSYFGFRDLTGADAFVESEITYPDGTVIYKKPLDEIDGSFDLIMLHHSFEHFADPLGSLREIRRLLAPTGRCLIRMPIVNFAWEKYGVNWVQLDPPRHLVLYTEKAFVDTVERAGFEIVKTVYDSEAFQFWGSEQYVRDIPMNDPRAFKGDIGKSIFTDAELREWQRQAEQLNKDRRGDQACFYLKG
jgi:SAM-dependent methyltransferase